MFHKLYRFVHSGAGWNAFEEAKLVKTHAKSQSDRKIELGGGFLELTIE